MILGAAKAGTTSLHNYMAQSPEICASIPKEPLFFEMEYERGLSYYLERYYAHRAREPVLCEARHRNLYLPYVADRIAGALDDPYLIVLLREPVSRAYSHYWHWAVRGLEPLSFEDAVEDNIQRLRTGPYFADEAEADLYRSTLGYDGWSPYRSYVDSGYYADQIERFVRLFGRERLQLVTFEELRDRPEEVCRRLFRWLGVGDVESLDVSPKNEAPSRAGMALFRVARALPGGRLLPHSLRTALRGFVTTRLPRMGSRPPLSPETERLLHEHYLLHNARLSKWLESGRWPAWVREAVDT